MSTVSRLVLLFVIHVCVSAPALCEPFIQMAEPRAATGEFAACADRKITHATGFIGMAEREVLATVYRQVMSPSMEQVIRDHVGSLAESAFPNDASREEFCEEELAGLGLLRSDFRSPRMVFALVEHVEGISPAEQTDLWFPGAWTSCLYTVDPADESMVPYRRREDEGFHECVVWLSVFEDGSVKGEIKLAMGAIGAIHWDNWELSWERGGGEGPPTLLVGNHCWVGVMDFY